MRFTNLEEIEQQVSDLDQLKFASRSQIADFLKPFHMAMLACELRRLGATGLVLNSDTRGYAVRMGVWEAIGLDPPELMFKRARPDLQPCTPLIEPSDMGQAARELARLIMGGRDDSPWYDDLFTVVHELVENAYRHSAVEDGHFGMTCAQTWRRGDLAQIAIVDTGIGFRSSLEQNRALNSRLEVENACDLALEKGVSGKLGKGHSGLGLALVSGLAERGGSNLLVLSGNEAVQVAGNGKRVKAIDFPWNGSVVVFEWRPSTSLDTGAVYSYWAGEGENDDFW